jgi:hypothetical protein
MKPNAIHLKMHKVKKKEDFGVFLLPFYLVLPLLFFSVGLKRIKEKGGGK